MQSNADSEALIQATSLKLNLNQFVIEKDLYVTEAISTVMSIDHDIFKLIFQGGTALAKAYGFTQRMSEDCDFRLVLKNPKQKLSKDTQRKHLREFRNMLLQALTDRGFSLDNDAIKVRNEGRFISMQLRYNSIYQALANLKPYITLEFFLGDIKTPAVTKLITSLIRQTLGREIQHPEVKVPCMSIPETAAEKWVALTRRIPATQQSTHHYKQALVRHIYDLMMLSKHYQLGGKLFVKLAIQIVENDRTHFKNQSKLYFENPLGVINQSLKELNENSIWEENWNVFINSMVYGAKPAFLEAITHFNAMSELVIPEIYQLFSDNNK